MSELKPGDWVQVSVGSVLFLTLLAVLWYAWEARRQAKASYKAAEEMRKQADATYELILEERKARLARGPQLYIEMDQDDRDFSSLRNNEKVPERVIITLRNDGQGNAYYVDCRMEWKAWTFSQGRADDIVVAGQPGDEGGRKMLLSDYSHEYPLNNELDQLRPGFPTRVVFYRRDKDPNLEEDVAGTIRVLYRSFEGTDIEISRKVRLDDWGNLRLEEYKINEMTSATSRATAVGGL